MVLDGIAIKSHYFSIQHLANYRYWVFSSFTVAATKFAGDTDDCSSCGSCEGRNAFHRRHRAPHRCRRTIAISAVVSRDYCLPVPAWGLTGAGLIIGPTVAAQFETLVDRIPVLLENLRSLTENLALRLRITQPESIRQFFDIQDLTS